jgi:PPOX class probable FMN-dependent enzyme
MGDRRPPEETRDVETTLWTEIGSADELRALVGEPSARVAGKDRTRLHEHDRSWLAASPFCLLATSAADGTVDVSPKGDPPGFTVVLDDTTIAIPERPGNRRADGFHNILSNPHVGLIYLVPGRGDTLRINGRARLVRDAPFLDDMVVKGHRPVLALVVEIEQIFYHCSKAFLRSKVWDPASWDPTGLPSRAVISQTLERPDDSIEELNRYYGPDYEKGLYG